MPPHPKTPSSLASFKSELVLPFWYRFTQDFLENRLLDGCKVVVVLVAFYYRYLFSIDLNDL